MISSFGENQQFHHDKQRPHDQLLMDSHPDPDGVLSIRQLAEQSVKMREENKRLLAQQERNEDVYTRMQDATTFHDPISLASQTEGPLEVMSGETVITRGSTQNETQQETQHDMEEPAGKQTQDTGNKKIQMDTGITIILIAAIISAGILVYAQYRRGR